MRFVPLRIAVQASGLHRNTLRKYADAGIIPSRRTPFGQRMFNIDAWIGSRPVTVCYARVSSAKQKDDLQRQVEWLAKREPQAEIVTDIGSGLNFRGKGLRSLLERSLSGEQLKIVVAHPDRLARFGLELIRWVVERNGGKIVVLGKSAKGSPAQELTDDLLAIISVFAARMHGLRKYRDKGEAHQAVPDKRPGGTSQAVDGCESLVLQPDDRVHQQPEGPAPALDPDQEGGSGSGPRMGKGGAVPGQGHRRQGRLRRLLSPKNQGKANRQAVQNVFPFAAQSDTIVLPAVIGIEAETEQRHRRLPEDRRDLQGG